MDFYDKSREMERRNHWTSQYTCTKCDIKAVDFFLFATSFI